MPRIVLSIDRLVLRGVERADAAGVADALKAELQVLLASGGSPLPTLQGSTHALPAGQLRLDHGADNATLGRAVAAHIAGHPAASPGAKTKAGPP